MSANATAKASIVNISAFIEPVPNWGTLEETVGQGWKCLTLGMGSLFMVLLALTTFVTSWFRRKLVRQHFALVALGGLVWSCLCLGLFLLVDPYSRWLILPVTVTRLASQLYKPTLLASYISLQNILIHIGTVPVRSNKLQSVRRVVTCALLYSILIITIELVLLLNPTMRFVRILPETFYLFLSSYMSVCFIYSGFKLTNYIEDTKLLDRLYGSREKDFACTDKIKTSNGDVSAPRCYKCHTRSGKDGGYDCMCKCKTKLRRGQTISTNIVDLASCSSDESDYQRTPRHTINHTIDVPAFGCSNDSDTYFCSSHINKTFDPILASNSEIDCTRSDDEMGPSYISESSKCCSNSSIGVIANYQTRAHSDLEGEALLSTCQSKNSDLDIPADLGQSPRQRQTENCDDLTDASDSFAQDTIYDNGYLADAETGFSRTKSNAEANEDCDSVVTSFFGKESTSYNLPQKPPKTSSSFSLLRIRQCYALQRAVPTTYIVTFILIINTIFHLYSVFGVYGIFGSGKVPEPWPWFLFQLLHRIVELVFLASLLVAICLVLGQRQHRRSRRSKRSNISFKSNTI